MDSTGVDSGRFAARDEGARVVDSLVSRALQISLIALLALAGAPHARAEAAIAWTGGWKAAERQARAERKPLLVDFWAEWCEWCHELDRTTYRDPRVVELSKGFVPVKVDAEGSLGEVELAGRYGVKALPTITFVTPAGRTLLSRTAFEGPDVFVATLEDARRLAAMALAFEAALDRDAKDAAALAGLGAVLAEQGASRDVRDLLGRARRLDQARPSAERKRTRRFLALAEAVRGKRADALALVNEALALQPADPIEDAAARETAAALADR